MALTPKQQRFVEEYLVDLNATQAAVRAGYSARTAHVQGSDNLTKPEVRAAVDKAMALRATRTETAADKVISELKHFAHADIGEAFDDLGAFRPLKDMPPHVRRSIASIKQREEVIPGADGASVKVATILEVKFWDKPKGLELLGKNLKLFTDKVEHTGLVTLEQLVTASIKQKVGG